VALALKTACTVENHGPPARLVGQDGILRPDGIRPLQVFIPLGGAKRDADSHDWLPHEPPGTLSHITMPKREGQNGSKDAPEAGVLARTDIASDSSEET
jgi:hypothetical protein